MIMNPTYRGYYRPIDEWAHRYFTHNSYTYEIYYRNVGNNTSDPIGNKSVPLFFRLLDLI